MTEQERKQFSSLVDKGWFSGEAEPLCMVAYDLSSRRIPPMPDEKKKKTKKTKAPEGTPLGLVLCRGYALFYAEMVVLYEEGQRVDEILLTEGEAIKCEIAEGTVSILLGARILFSARLKQKNAYYMLAKRFEDLKNEKDGEHESEKKHRLCIKCSRPLPPDHHGEVCPHCKSKKRVILKLWEMMRGSRGYIFLSIVLFFVVTGVNLIAPYLNRELVDTYIEPKNEALAAFTVVILSILAVNLLSRALSILRSRILISASNGVIIRLREEVFEKVENLSVSNIAKRTAGNLMHRINNDTAVIQRFLTNQFAQFIEQILMFIGVGAVLFIYDWKLALMILCPAPIVLILNIRFRRRVGKIYHTQWEKSSQVETFLHDIFSGIRVVKSFGTEERENKRFDAISYEECRIRMKSERFFALFSPIITFLIAILPGQRTAGAIPCGMSVIGWLAVCVSH